MKTKQSNDGGPRRLPASGFTLIEILAVVLILGLLMSLLLPAVGAGGARSLRKQADRLAATLELARQRAVVTGKPHRVVLDLEGGAFSIDWLVTEEEAYAAEDPEAEELLPERVTLPDGTPDLAAPVEDVLDYFPIPNQFGRMEALEPGYYFEGVETPEGWIETGQVYVTFEWDGECDAASIVISDPDERSIALDVAPLLETVGIHEQTD